MSVMSRRRSKGPNASNWDKISARSSGETLANRDVHGAQQLDRQALPKLRSKKAGYIGAAVLGVGTGILTWVLYSVLMLILSMAGSALGGLGSAGSGSGGAEPSDYYEQSVTVGANGESMECFTPLASDGQPEPGAPCYDTAAEVPVPDWYAQAEAASTSEGAAAEDAASPEHTLGAALTTFGGFKIFVTLAVGAGVGLSVAEMVRRRVDTSNLMSRTDDINQYDNDQHIALPEEVQRSYDWFPDVGAHSSVQVSSMLSHMMLANKGLPKVAFPERAKEDKLDDEGDAELYEGEIVVDENGEAIRHDVPLIDEKFGKALFEASEVFEKSLQRYFDARRIPYNPGGTNREKGKYETVADLIKADWTLPDYEPQRPAGAYIVDTAPVNTMMLAMTRAGKGQTYIEAVLDMWSRETAMNNFLANDPKGELLVKFYERLVVRGFEVIQFNLINIIKTDIYNPLGMAAESAREGDFTKMASYVENIAEVFFPVDGGDDPMWANAANNAFKRAAYGLIDYYLEEERELRVYAEATGMHPATLEQRLDEMWGNVTLYNCYQLFVQLTSRKLKNPMSEFEERVKNGEFEEDPEGEELAREAVEARAKIWEDKPELDMLTLFFNATAMLPKSSMRDRVADTDNALRAMAGAEKMMASVYGIALTAMSFFTDPTISTLTSGRPSQNVDLGGLSFPRRFGVRFTPQFAKMHSLTGLQAVWRAYSDDMFTQDLGSKFGHTDMVSREGWARYYFEGIFETPSAWIKLELRNPQSGSLAHTFYFQFTKSFQLSLNGRRYVTEPVTSQKQIKNGVLREMRPVRKDGEITSFRFAATTYKQKRLDMSETSEPELATASVHAIMRTSVRYSEKPKAIFLITPPHLTKYAKLVLILLKQLVDLNFDKAYMTKSSQKPLYKTRFMLDELGNLQSEGHGIANFETMLSIGLGQSQQFTVILQTLQQLREVYGDSIDRIAQGNISNIIYLKSTDDSMLETLEKLSGKTHRVYRDGKSVTQDIEKIRGMGRTEGKVSYNFNVKEEPLISQNDMLYLAPRNAIVFRAGDAPIWNRNETILPMSWRMFENRINHAGHEEYSLQTVPTMSTAMEFDVRMNQPDFVKALDKRMNQASKADRAKIQYQELYGYKDIDIKRLDPDVYADEVMNLISNHVAVENGADPSSVYEVDPEEQSASFGNFSDDQIVEDQEVAEKTAFWKVKNDEYVAMRYAEGMISREMLVTEAGVAKVRKLDEQIAEAYQQVRTEMEKDEEHFSVNGAGDLCSEDGREVYIRHSTRADLDELRAEVTNPDSRAYSETEVDFDDLSATALHEITAEFYLYLSSLPSWKTLARGAFDRAMAREMRFATEDHA